MSHKSSAGFTLVELMLSMAFISVMLIAIAMCVIQMSTIYTRGETLRQVNQASRALATDLQRTLGAADLASIDLSAQDRGRVCTGQFTYVWSTAENPYEHNVYTDASEGELRLVRLNDPGGRYCSEDAEQPISRNSPIDKAASQAVELLPEGDRSLRVYDLEFAPQAASSLTQQRLYRVSVLLGTDNVGAVDTTSNTCKAPSDFESDITYCAINQFNLTVRAGVR